MNSQWGLNPMDMSATCSSASTLPVASGMDPSAGMNPYAFMGMGADNMYGMMGNYSQFGQESGVVLPPKEIVILSKSVLYPPKLGAPQPIVRIKPPGCKTIFVGGLPNLVTVDILKEAFERFGEITTIRMSEKNFCHIKFAEESSVDRALHFSGYRMKIDNKNESEFTGRLHVDYALATDDKMEFELRQRAAERAALSTARMPTPPAVILYSEQEAIKLAEELRGEGTFLKAASILIMWLEKGECHKRNVNLFYSLIQSTNTHIRRLMSEKLKYEDELNTAKLMLKKKMEGILLQFNDIGKVFIAASVQKVWDHFTRAQRRNIELWKKQTEEIRNAHVEEVLNDRIEDEMDLSDDDTSSESSQQNNSDNRKARLQEELSKMKEECDSLRCQLEASQNETVMLRSDADQETDFKGRQIEGLKKALQGFQKEILSLNFKHTEDEAEIKELRALRDARKDELKIIENDFSHGDNNQRDSLNLVTSSSTLSITENEAQLIGLISTFLNVHPFGASIDYICSYLYQIDNTVRARDVESMMKRFPSVFNEASTGIGASLEKKWTFCGFN
ncbi:ecto-NOX disulfide-thiol exchanger 2-like [Uloborus diversus]|uniref:ecto-NOX disulfide-thiol exchanger 2-like n=1 Tax=Uloborus diversus TaxID=327109 RepID=UPI0024099A04|nr:ecto-NOX disulfide-thiol exchanger 2-like [Uloborus diversus]